MNDEIRDLMIAAGPRPGVPEADVEAIRRAARATFRARYGRRRVRWILPAAAALFIIAAGTWWAVVTRSAPPPAVAHVERVRGLTPFAAQQTIRAGASIETGSGSSIRLRLTGGQSLVIGEGTRAIVESIDLVRLDRGVVEIDTHDGAPIVVRTPAGDFRPLGTRFEVRVSSDGATRLLVHEGRVAFRSHVAGAGEQLVVAKGGTVERLRSGDPPDIEGKSLRSFLERMVAEQGWKLRFDSAETESLAETTVLHGSIQGLLPADALRTVVISSGFEHEVRDGVLFVRRGR